MANSIIDYDSLRQEQAEKINTSLEHILKMKYENIFRKMSIRVVILKLVVGGEFAEAEKSLDEFYESFSAYREFQEKMKPYLIYCKGLVRSIKVKKNLPNKEKLPGIRQKELVDKVVSDYNDLRMHLTKMEALKTEALFKDALSVRIFLRTFMICVSIIMCFWFFFIVYDFGYDFIFNVAESIGLKVAQIFY